MAKAEFESSGRCAQFNFSPYSYAWGCRCCDWKSPIIDHYWWSTYYTPSYLWFDSQNQFHDKDCPMNSQLDYDVAGLLGTETHEATFEACEDKCKRVRACMGVKITRVGPPNGSWRVRYASGGYKCKMYSSITPTNRGYPAGADYEIVTKDCANCECESCTDDWGPWLNYDAKHSNNYQRQVRFKPEMCPVGMDERWVYCPGCHGPAEGECKNAGYVDADSDCAYKADSYYCAKPEARSTCRHTCCWYIDAMN